MSYLRHFPTLKGVCSNPMQKGMAAEIKKELSCRCLTNKRHREVRMLRSKLPRPSFAPGVRPWIVLWYNLVRRYSVESDQSSPNSSRFAVSTMGRTRNPATSCLNNRLEQTVLTLQREEFFSHLLICCGNNNMMLVD